MTRRNFYTVDELAERSKELLGKVRKPSTIRRDCAAGHVPGAELIGTIWHIPKSSIRAYKKFVSSQQVGRPRSPKASAWFFPEEKWSMVEKLAKKHGGEIRKVSAPKDP